MGACHVVVQYKRRRASASAPRRVLAPLLATLILFSLGRGSPRGRFGPSASGGSGWHAQNASAAGSDASLNSVCFADATHGWAVGSAANGAVILATTDGGATWVARNAPVGTGYLNAVTFVTASDGWAVGSDANGAVILVTTDGGCTWSAEDAGNAGSDAALQSVSFVDSMHGWAVGWNSHGSVILATTDGGTTWTAHDVGSVDGSS